jgi:small GTP-binding protein
LATDDFSQEDFDTSLPVDILDGKLVLVDTNGQEDNDRMRGVAYKEADAFLVLFSIISPTSYNSVLTKWQPEVSRANALGKPVFLVGTKSDLRTDPDALQRLEARHLAPTSYDQGLRLAREMGATAYIECAANSPDGISELRELLDSLVNGSSKGKKKRSKSLASQTAASSKAESTCCNLI